MERYDHAAIEKKWQERWAQEGIYRTTDDPAKPKAYVLDMFPYPSGEGLHVGHPKGYIATDIYSRFKRMHGFDVLHPMGWDAFGLPAENFALKHKVHPRIAVEKNIANFKAQLAHIGFDYDWSREINTTDPSFYKWTQWIFLQLYKHGLAFESDEPINWCPGCLTGLANEDLEPDGTCERCGSVIEKKKLPQWVLKITAYADRMLADLDTLEWPEHIKEAQRNWIGRSEGAEIDFDLRFDDPALNENRGPAGEKAHITVFTTRPDTLFGATYLVLAPEHPWVTLALDAAHEGVLPNARDVRAYVEAAAAKDEIERAAEGKEKTGVRLEGVMAINPANGEEIPLFVADYVLGGYGTGAIMAVPAHDGRDHEFAKKFGLPIRTVVEPSPHAGALDTPEFLFTGPGLLVDSGAFTGMPSEEAKAAITEKVGGRLATTYKIKDWVFSRQRYWGEPIPIIHCPEHGAVPVPEDQLPVLLPEVESYEPSGTGESPLATIAEWVNTTCPICGGPAKRETNTMPQWAGSSWYYLRFMDPHDDAYLVAPEKEKHWAPVDVYVGGDHAVRHLIYARFWHKFLYDIGVVSTEEPFARLEFLGFILAEDGRKMSKRYGNVINPDDVVAEYGADAFRTYEMFMGPFENTIAWSTDSIKGAQRFIERIWKLADKVAEDDSPALEPLLNQTIKKVGDDIEAFKFNTAVSQMMIFLNAAEKEGAVGRAQWAALLKLLAPFAPHMTEELWERSGHEGSIHRSVWPSYDESKLVQETATIAVQVDGKTRGTATVERDADAATVTDAAKAAAGKWIEGKTIGKTIVVPNRLVNFVLAE
ncbi:MAG TPA: leucine--tRNA ligase [Candidatus Paceibacterota bacterium]|nr:leucine--tRNA ligase [Candidatus Paceibacterota bacterium]